MTVNHSFLTYFTGASPVVKTVMLILFAASMASWTVIIERALFLRKLHQLIQQFESRFWSGADLVKLYNQLKEQNATLEGLSYIFHYGFKEFVRLSKQSHGQPTVIMEGVQRAMRIACAREVDRLENHLALLATIGSTSPYIGLFGTVWGIMTSFHALGAAQQATIAMVAPGISEALVATAMGLFAAIPAVIAYNRFASKVERLINHYYTFQEEFSNILHRQSHTSNVQTSKMINV